MFSPNYQHRSWALLQPSRQEQEQFRLLNMALMFGDEEAWDGERPWDPEAVGAGKCVTVTLAGEHRPRPENRISLSYQRDRLGLRRSRVDLSLPEEDVASYSFLVERFVRFAGRLGLGRVRVKNGMSELGAGSHHMGTTRMGEDPATSVVDRDLQVHALNNLFCAGSSVFPTGGCANPTLTIVALSLRLRETLLARLRGA